MLRAACCAIAAVIAMGAFADRADASGRKSGLSPTAGRAAPARTEGPRAFVRGGRFERFAGRGPRRGFGFGGPFLGYGPTRQVAVLRERADEPARPRDPFAFENLPVRAGIPLPPTPEPTLYRLEGPRDRPATRVIRIDAPDPAGATRTRHVHGQTGALLLTVPRR